ncbi:hypothetical protein BGZ83_006414 [Gryganskiella cystojenkinii]|nr:hypothetical protein BGZ83_006414 [Gryganskiella cystojenkinii]
MTHCPWKKLSSGYAVPEANAVATTLDQKYLVLAGISNQVGQLAVVYEIATDNWSYLPPAAVSMAFPSTGRSEVGIALDSNTGQMILLGGLDFTRSTNSTTSTPAAPAVGSYSVSTELDILDTRSVLNTWSWSAVINTPIVPSPSGSISTSPQWGMSVVQPILIFLPELKATLIMGGCSGINITSGDVTSCQEFDRGYLINSMITHGTTSPAMVPITSVSLTGPIGESLTPSARISPCVVLLPSGQVFMYGGASMTGSLNDAWLLTPGNWSWTSIQITNMPIPGRAGAACQMATKDQMILVGGFDGGLTGPRQFSDPQLAVINTTSWTWTMQFTPDSTASAPGTSSSRGLSSEATYGIVAGVCVLLLAVATFFVMRWYLPRRYRREGPPPSKNAKDGKSGGKFYNLSWWSGHSLSRDPLVRTSEEDKMLSMDHVGHTTGTSSSEDASPHLLPPPLAPRPPRSLSSTPYPLPPRLRMDKSPFLIIPYAPPASPSVSESTSVGTTAMSGADTNATFNTFNTSTSGSSSNSSGTNLNINTNSGTGSGTTLFSPLQHNHRYHQSPHFPIHQLDLKQQEQQRQQMSQQQDHSSTRFSRGDRLPQDLADVQQGFYNKTQQHNKYYEMRRQNEIRQHPELDRSGTIYSMLERVDADNELAEANQRYLQQQYYGSSPYNQGYYSSSGLGSASFYPVATSSSVSDTPLSQHGDPTTGPSTTMATTPRIPLSTSASQRSFSYPLREIEVGEESITGNWNGIDDGTLLMSSHLETAVVALSRPSTSSALEASSSEGVVQSLPPSSAASRK